MENLPEDQNERQTKALESIDSSLKAIRLLLAGMGQIMIPASILLIVYITLTWIAAILKLFGVQVP